MSAVGKKLSPLHLILVLVVLLRIPSLFEPYWYGDEAIYLTLGQGIKQGLILYKNIFDHKPPVIYLLAAASGSVFWFRLLLLFWHAATIAVFWDLANRLFSKKEKMVVLATSLFALLTTIPLFEGNIANSEIFMLGPTVGAFLLLFSAKKLGFLRLFSAGLLFSLAVLFKVPAVFDLFALGVFWVMVTALKRRAIFETARQLFITGLGFSLPILLTVVYFWSAGGLSQYVNIAWFQNFTYISRWDAPAFSLATTLAQAGMSLRAAVLALVLLFLFVLRKRLDKTLLFSLIWFSLALFAALLSGRPYPHYIIQVIPPLSLLVSILMFGREKERFWPVPFLLLFLISLVFYKFYYYPTFPYYANFLAFAKGDKTQGEYFEYFDKRTAMIYRLAQIISERTGKSDRVFIWGTAPEVYALSHRLPPGRYITSFHIKDFDGKGETMAALKKSKPKYIIILRDEKDEFPEFFKFLYENFVYLETVGQADVWKRVNFDRAKTKL